jgi:uncharacterized protein
MNDPQANVEKLKAAYRVWHESGGRDASKWFDLAADDLSIFSLGQGAVAMETIAPQMEFSAPVEGPGALARYVEALQRDWELLAMHTEEFIVDGECIVMMGVGEVRCRGTGKSARSPLVHYWRFKEGKAVDFREFYDTAGAFAAATPDRA